ncbi:MAG: ribosome-associated translation inhibitor RaiA [Planctomycetes bacterium]|nr:ribosome-associated translation inhibitor RaiA [Planctomycetota bacterium]
MKLQVAILHHQHFPEHVREHIEAKLQHLARYFGRTESLQARLERQRDTYRIELVANLPRGVVLVVEGRAQTMDAALDESLRRMTRVLARHKDRLAHGGRRKTG